MQKTQRFMAGKRGAVLAAALLLAGCTSSSPTETATTPPVELSAELATFAAEAIGQGAPAVVFHVRRDGQSELGAAGVKDLESNRKAEPADKVWISGAGAPMVSVAVMKLVESGRVRLDDPVAAHLPEFAAILPGWPTTVRELLGSRSGLPDYIPPLVQARSLEELQTRSLTFEERLRIAAGVGAPPGPVSYFAWSATDWEVLAWLLERVHGRTLAEILASEVFEPAGMDNTLVAAPGPPPEPMLHGYVLSDGQRVDFTRTDAVAGSGDAGIISTVEDMGRFVAALTTERLVGGETWQAMVADGPYSLGGFEVREEICPGTRHVAIAGGGGAYNIQSVSAFDGARQVTAAMALPPRELDTDALPPLVTDLDKAVRATATAMCG